jgi:hypothetical protein
MFKFVYKKIRVFSFTPLILKDFFSFKKKNIDGRFPLSLKNVYPQPFEKTFSTHFDRHYVYHTSWAARKLKEINPEFHIDISSSLYFSGIVSAFVPVEFYDYRPAELKLSNFKSKAADLLDIPFDDNSMRSLSCMHVVEHIGLGRYGDKLDPEGDLKAIKELKRVVSKGGSLLFVVPMGEPKIMFNAHRVYSYEQIVEYFSDFTIKEFAFIPEKKGEIVYNASPNLVTKENYGCGCFWFIKK